MNGSIRIMPLVDVSVAEGFIPEFGLSLLIEAYGHTLLFDTGAGYALPVNMHAAGISPGSFTEIILSHGHYDHTGGLSLLAPQVPFYTAPGIEKSCYSLHEDGTVHELTMPEKSRRILAASRSCIIRTFTEIAPGIHLTGPLPRLSGKDGEGAFFEDPACRIPHSIPEEQALLLQDGILVTGCCHAGLVNTVEACRKFHPEIRLRAIVGGFHLRHANRERCGKTAEYLESLDLEMLLPMHCTGELAANRLKELLSCPVETCPVGKSVFFPTDGTEN